MRGERFDDSEADFALNRRDAFRPINQDHAIQSVKFALTFRNVILPDAVQKIAGERAKWVDALPAFGMNETVVDSGIRKLTLPVANFAFLRPDGTANWSMNVGGSQVTVECFLYTRWERVWRTASEYMSNAADILASAQNNLELNSIELAVRDVFVSSGETYSLDTLLNRDQKFISPMVFDAGPAWHCHVGWFEGVDETVNTLNHLNSDATQLTSENNSWAVGITHFQQDRLSTSLKLTDIVAADCARIEKAMARLHLKNKGLLRLLLVDDMADKISLGGTL